MSVWTNYTVIALWLLFGLVIARNALFGTPVRGGMVNRRPRFAGSWPLLAVVWVMGCLALSFVVMPAP